MKPIKETVYLLADGKDCDFIVKWYDDSYENDVKKESGYFFTPEELNEYTANVIKQTLETASEKAKIEFQSTWKQEIRGIQPDVNKKSITNTFEETFNKFKL